MSFACRMKKVVPITVSATNVTGSDSGFSPQGSVQSDTQPNPVIENGTGSYSYLWTRVSGDSPSVGIATSENPVWGQSGVNDGDPSVSTWRLTVTDLNTSITATTTITVTLSWHSTQ